MIDFGSRLKTDSEKEVKRKYCNAANLLLCTKPISLCRVKTYLGFK